MRGELDADGQSLRHNSMIVDGVGQADGYRHTHSNLPILLLVGVLQPGWSMKRDSQLATHLFLSLADRLGVQGLERFGDSSGRLTGV